MQKTLLLLSTPLEAGVKDSNSNMDEISVQCLLTFCDFIYDFHSEVPNDHHFYITCKHMQTLNVCKAEISCSLSFIGCLHLQLLFS